MFGTAVCAFSDSVPDGALLQVVSMCTAFVHSFGGLVACRFIIGALEGTAIHVCSSAMVNGWTDEHGSHFTGGMQPGLAFYLSR